MYYPSTGKYTVVASPKQGVTGLNTTQPLNCILECNSGDVQSKGKVKEFMELFKYL